MLVVEGRPAGEAIMEEQAKWAEMTVEEHVQMYARSGMSEKDAIKAAAADRGVSKRDIYNIIKVN